MINHSSLFNGIGGFQLAAFWHGFNNVFHCEKDKKCNLVTAKHFPNSICYEDITETDFTRWRGLIHILTGGPPCQPFSKAGKQRGHGDYRSLIHEYKRAVKEIRPNAFILENVANLQRHGFEPILSSLENIGYTVEAFFLPSSSVGGLSNRNRVWIIGIKEDSFDTNTDSIGWDRAKEHNTWAVKRRIEFRNQQIGKLKSMVSKSIREGTHPGVFRDAVRIPDRVDRLKQIGNAIDPRIAYLIMSCLFK